MPSQYSPETNEQTTFTQEINLISGAPLFGKLDWVAGIFYLDTEVEISILELLDFNFNGTFDPFTVDQVRAFDPAAEIGFISNSKPERDSASIYGQGTWNFNDVWRAVFGLRYTDDEVYRSVTNFYGRSGTDIIEMDSEKVTGRLVVEHDFNDSTWPSFPSPASSSRGSNLTYGLESDIARSLCCQHLRKSLMLSKSA